MTAGHEIVHILHVDGVDEMDPGQVLQNAEDAVPDHRAQVDGVDQLQLRVGGGQLPEGLHDVHHGLSVVLPAVAGDGDDPPMGEVQLIQLRHGEDKVLPYRGLHGVDDGVAGDELVAGNGLPLQIPQVVRRGAEVELRDVAHQGPVHLLREGGVLVPGAETGLHVAHGDLVIESGQSSGKGGGGVTVDQDQVRLRRLQHLLHAQQGAAGDGGQGLAGLHDVQVIVGLQPENVHDGVQHLPVLTGETAEALKLRAACQVFHQGGHLDGLGPGAEYRQNLDLIHCQSPVPFALFPPGAPAEESRA